MRVIYSDIKSESFNNRLTSCPLILPKLSKFPNPSEFGGFKSLTTTKQILHKRGGGASSLWEVVLGGNGQICTQKSQTHYYKKVSYKVNFKRFALLRNLHCWPQTSTEVFLITIHFTVRNYIPQWKALLVIPVFKLCSQCGI